ncbi:MAG: hypothetical protein IMY67_10205, partial [Bacteroidetes bacterium]|nr:hypothetical protein [Bacteroidota bacterium]
MSKPLSLLVTLLCAPFVFGQINIDFCEQLDALKEIIVSEHISPKPLGDDLSKGVYSLFIQSLDPDKIFFTKSDLQEFSIDEYNLDQYIISHDCSFIDKYITKLAYRINSTKKILETLFLEKLDYSGKDTIHFMPKNELYYYKT